jgi:DNA-directed RNA polymerase beta subunit
MNYSSIHPANIIRQKLLIDKNVIFITFPDTNLDIAKEIYNTNFLISNCKGLVCPNKMFSIGRRKFNGKEHFYDIKRKMIKDTGENKPGRKIRVLNSLVIEKPKRETLTSSKNTASFFFYDASIWSKALNTLMQQYPEKAVTLMIFDELKTLYEQLKNNNPTHNVEVLFLIKNQAGHLYNIFQNIRRFIKLSEFKDYNFFDTYTLISDCEGTLLPIFRKEDNETSIIIQNLTKLEKFIEVNTTIDDINKIKENAVSDNVEDGSIETLNISQSSPSSVTVAPTKENEVSLIKQSIQDTTKTLVKSTESVLTNIVKSLQTSTLVATKNDKTDEIKLKVNQDELRNALKSHKITDPDIVANVQTALNQYINHTKTRPSQDQAEDLVLRAINYTLTGSDVVSDEYLHKPKLLFDRLKQINTYKVPLDIVENNNVISPNEIIDLKYTTGQHRQKFEFETAIHENVSKLFNSLETVGTEYPIKVKSIEHEIKDDNVNRYINYKVTLQNLNGGKKEPYVVELKVPSPVNEKYFKLHGNNYIMSNQQFLRPVTKTDKNEVRMISNYAIVRVGLAHIKFNPTDLVDILKYIEIRYPTIIKKKNDDYCEFNDGSIVYLTGTDIYKSKDLIINTDIESGRLQNTKTKEVIKQNKFEFLFDVILDKIQNVNPKDNLSRTKKNNPYFWIYIGSKKIPLIFYLWSQKGLLSVLNEFEIDYEFVDKMDGNDESIYLEQDSGKYLKITPETLKQKYLLNIFSNMKFKEKIKDFNNPEELYPFVTQNYGSRTIILLRLISENFVDPITKELLQFENMPTNLVDLTTKVSIDQLLNKPIDSLSDLKIYRTRLSEVILNLVYKQIKLSHNYYRKKIIEGDEKADVFLEPDYVINSLITTAGVLQNTEPVNPVTELLLASRVIKTGKGGIPSKRSVKKEHRNIHPSQYGIMGAVSTPEYVDVGVTTHHTLTPIIINKYGSYGAKDITQCSDWQVLALDESLTPFQNQVDSDRMTLARTHSNQTTPVENSEQPLVCSGAEFIVPQLASPRFIHKAKKAGVITEVIKNKTITVKYNDNTTEVFDIIPRLSRTKRGSFISLEMNTLGEGTKVKANQPIAFTKNFNQNGVYCAGKNVNIALFNYNGYCHEDSYVITKSLADTTKTDTVEEVDIIVPPETKVLSLEKEIGKELTGGEVLVEFSYNQSIDDYITTHTFDSVDFDDDSDELITGLLSSGDHSIKKIAPSGKIIDIKVFINNKNSTDSQILSFHINRVKEQKQLINKLSNDKTKKSSTTDNMDLSFINFGNHKVKGSIFNGARIVYYIKRPKSLNICDKISNRYGSKGIISKILDKTPKGEFTTHIDVFLSPMSVLGRKNVALIKELYLGKIFYNANEQLDRMANDPKIPNDKLAKFIIDLYSIIGPKKVTEQITKTVNNYSGNKLRQAIKTDEIYLYCLVEPFQDISFQSIKTAAKFLNIPLEEKVYIPELDTWTAFPVPVGIAYYQFLEHYSDVYSNVRSTGRFTGLTRQPTKRKNQEGGQSVGGNDIYAFLTFDANNIISELLGPRSDEHVAKRELYNSIIENGEMPTLKVINPPGGTKDIFDIYILGMGLSIQ